MSDLSATQCGCGGNGLFGNDGGCSCIWIILILLFCCGDCGDGIFGSNGGGGNSCIWIILILLLCNGCGDSGRSGCGCGC